MTDAKLNYKDTIFLPQTDFPMKAGLAVAEPKWLDLWKSLDLYNRLQKERAAAPTFVLHDGPPYANGDIHVGHAIQKILKDATVRFQSMLGKRAPYVPGWDCHGLPIEWKIEEKYRNAGKDKDEVPLLDFRAECRAFAQYWVDVQSAEFQRLGVMGEWDNPYLTMTFGAEAAIVAEVHKFTMNGGLYRGIKPVMWSPVEKTALAEAEVEYHEHNSPTAMVAFPIVSAPNAPELVGAKIVIWTTTPWTLPANRAIAYGDFRYRLVELLVDTNFGKAGSRFIVADDLHMQFLDAAKILHADDEPGNDLLLDRHRLLGNVLPSQLQDVITAHPLRGQGYEHDVPLLAGDFVTTDAGTGFVHIAPSHGMDDYQLGLKHNLEMPEYVLDDGSYANHMPLFAGLAILDAKGKNGPANKAVLDAIAATGNLVASSRITHSYPHSWRSKAPVIFRATPQWFISMETNSLRETALQAITDTKWYPATGENRIRAMVSTRPDWNISRQRAWGVPLGIFYHTETLQVLRDEAVNARIKAAFEMRGADAWYDTPAQTFLGENYSAADYTQVFDIVDVWFESGSTHAFVLEARGVPTPADLYFEGSDQHRGWFQSSLLESCGTRGHAPFKAVVTHGFVNDAKGYKMSKSVGNVIAPETLIREYGADILRLWVVTSDYMEEMRIGPDAMKQTGELYRRLRNTLRYLLGALSGWDESERLEYSELEELERYMLHQLATLDGTLRAAIARYDYTELASQLHNFCNSELSSFYFDIRKDSLYCDAVDSKRRRSCRTLFAILYNYLTAWLAPILCFTAEEAWQHGKAIGLGVNDAVPSVHLRTFPEAKSEWLNEALEKRWIEIRSRRSVITGALEGKRAEKFIGSALEALIELHGELPANVDWAEVCIASQFNIGDPEVSGAYVTKAPGDKCERCWRVLPEVTTSNKNLCLRCEAVIA